VQEKWMHRTLQAQFFLSLILAASFRLAVAQSGMSLQEADRQLNSRYQEAMRSLSPTDRERLRKTERAWVAFADKNLIAMRTAAQALGIPSTLCEEIQAKEMSLRSNAFFLKMWPVGQNNDVDLAQVDNDLNKVYQRCVAVLPDKAKKTLREAQRAWIEYRDANRPFGTEFIAGLTSRRADQLTEFYISGTTSLSMPPAVPKARSSPPDPFERAR
jgi:uncharacterized protein YecT (DUF1311 family)